MSYQVPFVSGDGIGAEISASLKKIFQAAEVPVQWIELELGQAALDKGETLFPSSSLHAIQQQGCLLKGPLTSLVSKEIKDLNAWLNVYFQISFRGVVFQSLPGVPSRYQGIQFTQVNSLEENSSEQKAQDFMRQVFDYAQVNHHRKISLVHQSDIEKEEAIFLMRAALKISIGYPDIVLQDLTLEQACKQLIEKPEKFDLLVSSGKISGILSHLAMGLSGGIALPAASNVGKEIIIFEPVHGTAGDITGMGIANPVAMIRAGLLLLRHLQLTAPATRIEQALFKTLADSSFRTVDINGTADTEKFTRRVIEQL